MKASFHESLSRHGERGAGRRVVETDATQGAPAQLAQNLVEDGAVTWVVAQVARHGAADAVTDGLIVAGVAERPADRGFVVRALSRLIGAQTLTPRT